MYPKQYSLFPHQVHPPPHIGYTPSPKGYNPVTLAGGGDDGGDGGDGPRGPAGFLQLFDEKAVDALNVLIHLIQAPESLAYVLEAAGSVTLERCGAILDERAAVPE